MRSDSSNVKTLCIETARPSESNPAPTLALVAGTVTVTIYPAPLSVFQLLHGQRDLAAQHFDFLRDSGNIRRRGGIDQIGGLAVVLKDTWPAPATLGSSTAATPVTRRYHG